MTDIHSHILPWLDDGAADLQEALEMARIAAADGVTAMIATPHCNLMGMQYHYTSDEYWSVFKRMEQAIKDENIPLILYPGMEVFATPELPWLLKHEKLLTLNQSRYLLIEFAFDEKPDFVKKLLNDVMACGVLPVVAHAERYDFVQDDPQIAYDLQKNGCLIQVNKGSIMGRFGKDIQQTAMRLLQHSVVSVVASDTHGSKLRSPGMAGAYHAVETHFSKMYADLLFVENPKRISLNQATYRLKAKAFKND